MSEDEGVGILFSSRRSFLLGSLAASIAPRARAAARPNILLIVSDDQRFDTIRALGNSSIRTPNLDRLVKQGVTFTNAFVPNPICTPSRACLLSGRGDWETKVRWFEEPIEPTLPLWPEVMESQGYDTFYTGKWHNDLSPEKRGFKQTRYVFNKGMGDHRMTFDEGGRKVEGFSSELFANAAIDYLKKPGDPFFGMVCFTAPHDPRTPPERFAAMYDPAKVPLPKNFMVEHPFDNGELKIRDEQLLPWPRTEQAVRQEIAKYYGMISHMDEQIGRILDTLDETGLAENTIVAFTSDNGLAIGSHGLLGKMSMYDHSVRVPMIVRLPGNRSGGKRIESLCYNYQLFGTLCDLASVKAPTDVYRDSLAGLLKEKPPADRAVFASYRDVQRMVRTDDMKLIWYPKSGTRQLFDVGHDPDELRDLSRDSRYAGTMRDLTGRLAAHMRKCGDPLAEGLATT
jgi:arylsulfatase A-like enzyme